MPDLVAQTGGVLVVLGLHGLLQIVLETLHALGDLLQPRHARGQLAGVVRALVHRLEQVAQALGERVVTLAATQPARLLEIRLREPAHRAFRRGAGRRRQRPVRCPCVSHRRGCAAGAGGFSSLDAGAQACEQFGQREARRVFHAALLRASLQRLTFCTLPLSIWVRKTSASLDWHTSHCIFWVSKAGKGKWKMLVGRLLRGEHPAGHAVLLVGSSAGTTSGATEPFAAAGLSSCEYRRSRASRQMAEAFQQPLRDRSGLAVADDARVALHHRHEFRRRARDEALVRHEHVVAGQFRLDDGQPDLRREVEHRAARDAAQAARADRRREELAALDQEHVVRRAFGDVARSLSMSASAALAWSASILARMLLR